MSWSGIFGGLLGAGASIYNNERNNAYARQAAAQENKWNQEAAELSWQRELQLYEDQKQYNSPAAQMQRYKDAGLNANLIYGQGGNGNMTTMPKYDTPHMVAAQQQAADLSQLFNTASFFFDLRKKKAEAESAENKVYGFNIEKPYLPNWVSYKNDLLEGKSSIIVNQADFLKALMYDDPDFRRGHENSLMYRQEEARYNLLRRQIDAFNFRNSMLRKQNDLYYWNVGAGMLGKAVKLGLDAYLGTHSKSFVK